jgi:hypothetical protein
MWPQTSDIRIDGVMYMDPYTLAALLKLTGPVTVKDYDQRLSADMAAQFLLRDQYEVFPFDDRHDFLVSAATTVFNALTAGDLPGPAKIADTLAPSANEGRLLLHSFHPAEQALFERLHLDGTLPPVRGDYLSVRASNRGLSKIDAYMERTILDTVTVDPSRNLVTAVVAVKVKNTAPASGLPFEVIGNHVGKRQGTNSTTVSIVTPLDVTDVMRNGVSVGRGSYVEYGRHVYTALLDVPPGTESMVVFNLRGSLDLSHGYTLDVIPQPLANPDRISIHVNGASGWTAPSGAAMLAVLRVPQHLDVVLRE